MNRVSANSGVIIRQTVYGLAARERPASLLSSLTAPNSELLTLLFCAVTILLLGLGHIALKTEYDRMFVVLVLISITSLCYIAQVHGFNSEVRLDIGNRQILRGRVNRLGEFRFSKSFRLADVESIYIMRSTRTCTPSRMFIRCGKSSFPQILLRGPEQELVEFLEAVVEQLKVIRPTKKSSRINSDFRMHSFNVKL